MGSEYLYNSPISGKIYQQITDGEVSSEIFKEKRNYKSSTYLPNPKFINIDKDIQPSLVGPNTERYDDNGNLYRTPTQLQINQNLQEFILGKSSLTHIRSTTYTPYNDNPFKFTKGQQSELIFNKANVTVNGVVHTRGDINQATIDRGTQLPEEGEFVYYGGFLFEVTEMDGAKIEQLKMNNPIIMLVNNSY